MSNARRAIFDALTSIPDFAPAPSLTPEAAYPAPPMPSNPVDILAARLTQSGGRLQRARRDSWPLDVEWPLPLDEIRSFYCADQDERSRILRSSEIANSADSLGSTEADALDALTSLDVCVLRAEFAVVENGAAWHRPASTAERRAALLAEHLIVLVEAEALVASLHHAYARIAPNIAPNAPGPRRFGWFLCGPSKTADIEQSLVLGAHGPRTMSLVLLDD